MDLKKEYAVDEKKAEEGVWEDFGGGCTMLIARAGTKRYNREFQKISKPYRKAIQRKTISAEKSEQIMVKVAAQCILLDWKGLKEDGVELEYSTAEAERVLKKYPDLYNEVMEFAESIEGYRAELDENSEKNSEMPSTGG